MCPFRLFFERSWAPLGMNIRGDTEAVLSAKSMETERQTAKAGFRTDRTRLYKKK